jgi:hypothetical protein
MHPPPGPGGPTIYADGFLRLSVNHILTAAANPVNMLAMEDKRLLCAASHSLVAAPPILIKANHPPTA